MLTKELDARVVQALATAFGYTQRTSISTSFFRTQITTTDDELSQTLCQIGCDCILTILLSFSTANLFQKFNEPIWQTWFFCSKASVSRICLRYFPFFEYHRPSLCTFFAAFMLLSYILLYHDRPIQFNLIDVPSLFSFTLWILLPKRISSTACISSGC